MREISKMITELILDTTKVKQKMLIPIQLATIKARLPDLSMIIIHNIVIIS